MIKKRVNKINWHGSDLENNRAKAPNISTPGGNGLDGLNDGEIYVCNADEDPAIFIKTNKDKVARVGGNGSDSYSRDQIDDFLGKKLDKVVWDRNLEERVDDNGEEYLFLTKPLITTYGVTMYAGADVQVPSIYEGLPIDGVTIQWVDGKLVATGGKGTANGIVVNGNTYTPNEDGIITLPNYPTSLEWDNISGKPSWIGSTKPSYSWDEIGGKPSVFPTNWENVSDKPSWIGATKPTYDFSEIQNKPTTIAGYGITDAYTKNDISGLLADYVTKSGAQDITGIKSFINGLNIGDILVKKHSDGVVELDGDLILTGSLTMFAQGSHTASTILDALPIDNTTLSKEGGVLSVIGGVGGGSVDGIILNGTTYSPDEATKLITLPNYPTTLPASDVYSWAKQPNKPSYSFGELSSHPTTLGGYGITDAYTKTDADSRYFRHIGDTYEDGRNTGWIGFGTGTYINAYPDGIAHKIYSYGQVTSFNSSYSRLELYSTHTSSDPNDGNNGIQFRSGWNDDKKSWRMLLDEVNYLHYTDNRYVNKAGDTMTGKLLFNANSSIDLVYIPRTKSAISFNNAGSNRIGINSTDGDGNLRIAKTDINQDWVSGDVNILLGSNNYKVLHTGNYAGELDNRYVNKIGDAMTGNLVFAHTSERPSYSGSIGITFREQIANGQGVKLVYNDYDNYRAPAGLILVGEQGGEYFEAPAIYQNGYKVWDAGNKRDMFSSMNEAFTTWGNEQVISVEGDANTYYPVVITINHSKTWNSRIAIHKNLGSRTPSYPGNHGNGTSSMWAMYEGRYSGWDGNSGYIVTKYVRQPYANLISKAEHAGNSVGALVVYLRGGGCEYTVCTDYRGGINVYYERTEISGDSNYPVYVEPTTSVGNQGVLNMVSYDYLVQKAVRLETPRAIFSKPFDGTNNVTGGAKFNSICIETDNNGNDNGRGSEINNYNAELNLQYDTSRDITMCFGGGNVRIGTGISSYKLNVNGDTYCSGKITSGNWIRSDLYSAGIDHYADDSYSAAYNACAPNNDNYCCYSIVRSGTIPLGIGFNTNSEIWLGTVNTNRKAAAQWLQISGNRVTCSGDILAYGGITMYGSDETKKNIIERFILPLDYVVNAPLWRYTWRDNRNDRINIGGSAQYTQLMMNELVGDSDKGLTMDYATTAYAFSVSIAKHFQRFLIEDFGRHETEIERLKRENEDMKNRIIELERRAA